MTRLNKILIGALAVQVVLAVVMLTRSDRTEIAALRPVIAKLDVALVKKLAVFDKNADKPAVELVRAGNDWRLASHFDYPADATKVDALLGKLAAMRTRGPIATSAARHEQLAVADKEFERKLVVTTAAGDTTIFVGNARGGGRTSAVRIGGTPAVHAVTQLTAWSINTQPAQWIEPTYFEVDRNQIARILVQGPGGSVELDHGAAGWQLTSAGLPVALAPGESLDTSAVEALITQLAKVTVFEPGDPKRDASAPTATISVWVSPADPAGAGASPEQRVPDHVLDVVLDGENYWIHDRSKPTAGKIGKGGLSTVVESSRDKLVKKPTAPVPAPKPAPKPAPSPRPPG